ncbi:hypothetical protein B0F90DRAFT_335279 [Multifurca ochricompacta]|uniref:Fe2OG dioxygenase domain-containing protein n=1 Tax=Multifurca ochricompacta TaxID=376703 RepID=A0AAD4LVL9_9AGAM|nr:hypothetical protein B0F90DRAFT_335279 [Multifurca ochricompacta]
MFGSLVIVFPTAHEGGTLHLRHDGQEWTFNSGLELAGLRTPTIGYIAFFSDIEHEVAPVISGHRVTLTYNLYFYDKGPISKKDSTSEGNSYPPVAVNERAFRETLEDFLENPEFLAVGGTLGFGLRHIYPVSKSRMLRDIYNLLKGSDAAVFRSFKTLGFEPTLYMYYEGYSWQSDSTEAAIINNVMFSFNDTENPDIIQEIASRGGLVVWHKDHAQIDSKEKWANPEKVHWVTPVMEFNRQEGSYATYGNSPELKLVYGYLCLVVRIGKAGERLAYPTIAQLQKERHRERSSVI